ncbi:hypothetical protein AMAG_18871 [Allomyces macrogynus ATCC 38327]|uniref:Uncharacterized protein n=1 Tax=Allomyces macrogynus (strain ATCC 38327) TaxID=578462 RepID=A0A0L0SJ45_ALLM3|nr:hypothetical protein AMAG_18871 [Allomyces macrogynus ATCC 38327]|eukprot:KNE62497.1 hypothetical protein AMAG_18871 [Allomyces macrogynus ATCC 38327]
MVGSGLLDELWHVRGLARETVDADKTGLRGVFQAIGYKELAPYLDAADRVAAEAQVVVEEGVEKVEKFGSDVEPGVPEAVDELQSGETVESAGIAEQSDAAARSGAPGPRERRDGRDMAREEC